MYQAPTIYTGEQRITGEALRQSVAPLVVLGQLQRIALEKVVAKANEDGEYLDPNSVVVTVRVEGRTL